MSAWIVSKAHIDFLVAAARAFDIEVQDGIETVSAKKSPDQFGKILWDENHRSVNYRYDEKKETPEYHYDERFDKFEFKSFTGIGFLETAVGCYDYQTCECDDYKESVAYEILQKMDEAIDETLHELSPVLNAASKAFPWGLDTFEQIEEAKKRMKNGWDRWGGSIA